MVSSGLAVPVTQHDQRDTLGPSHHPQCPWDGSTSQNQSAFQQDLTWLDPLTHFNLDHLDHLDHWDILGPFGPFGPFGCISSIAPTCPSKRTNCCCFFSLSIIIHLRGSPDIEFSSSPAAQIGKFDVVTISHCQPGQWPKEFQPVHPREHHVGTQT